jgi:perosamine synthetase
MVLARSADVMDKCRRLKSQGVSPTREYWHDMLAYNYRMTNIQAAIGLAQIEIAEEIITRKQQIAEIYRTRLSRLPLRTHDPIGDVNHSHWMCSIIVDRIQDRDRLRAHLAGDEIETRPFFPLASHMPHCRSEGIFPKADSVSRRGINLPSYPGLTQEQLNRICSSIADYFESRSL